MPLALVLGGRVGARSGPRGRNEPDRVAATSAATQQAATSKYARVRRRPPAELDAPVGSAPWKGVVRPAAAGSWQSERQSETAPNHAVRKRPREEVRPAAAGSWQAEPAAIRKRPPAEARPAEHALPFLKETPHYGDRACTKFRHWLIPTVHSGLQHAACKYKYMGRAI